MTKLRLSVMGEAVIAHPRMSILILEDDDMCRESAGSIVRAAGFDVICARHFDEAMNPIESGARIDVALVDVQMPSGTPHGLSFARMAQLRRPLLKVIFMSAHTGSKDFILLDETDVFLLKPLSPHHLIEAIQALSRANLGNRAGDARGELADAS